MKKFGPSRESEVNMKSDDEKLNVKSNPLKASIGRIAVLAILVVFGAAFFYYRDNLSARISKVLAATDEDPIPVTKLMKQPFSLTVPSTGEIVGLEATGAPTPSTSSGSLSIAWLIPEGSFVKAGDPVIRFDSTDAKLNLEKQQNTLDANQENTKIKTWGQSTDEKVLTMDRTDAELEYQYAMTVMPEDESIFSKWDIITAQADAHYAKERIDFLKSKGKTQQRIARSDQQILAIERNKAQSQITLLKQTLNSLELQAPVGGLVLYRRDRREDPQIGDQSYPGQVIVEVINLDVLQARIYVLERDGGSLAKGQPVVIKLDAIPEKEYSGVIRTVSSVAASLERNSPLRYFTCDVDISDAGRDLKRIRPGMNLRGDVVLQKYESCFVVPSGAVNYREKEKDNLVYIKKGDSFEAKTVQTGLSSHGEAIILSGVEDGELIALSNPFETRKLYLPDFSKGGTEGGGMPGGMPPGGMMNFMRGGRR
jgi:multidrug efflux pump subunit AcrA (membrane-fusion protein)